MRLLKGVLVVALAVVSPAVSADVRLGIKSDGSKFIYNVGGSSGRAVDYQWLARQRDRVTDFEQLIQKYSRAYGVDPVLVKAVIQVESGFNPLTVSNKGARGLMQLMPGTARRFRVSRVHDPEENIRGGVAYLAALMRMFPNDLPRVLAGYNAGENAVLKYGGIPPYGETQTYVKKALTVYYGRPYGGVSGAVSFAGSRQTRVLRGGFKQKPAAITIASLTPGVRVLSSNIATR